MLGVASLTCCACHLHPALHSRSRQPLAFGPPLTLVAAARPSLALAASGLGRAHELRRCRPRAGAPQPRRTRAALPQPCQPRAASPQPRHPWALAPCTPAPHPTAMPPGTTSTPSNAPCAPAPRPTAVPR
uniref:Uncharacterized protein n=1 Tax=Arundo donax TaxID=35708 RepID=A0A0A9FQX5_ARUDO